MENRVFLESDDLRRFIEEVLKSAGVDALVSQKTAEGLWMTSLRGTDSHGVRLLPHYLDGIKGGRINPNPQMKFFQNAPTGGKLDADHGFAHAAGSRAMDHAIEMADRFGCGFVSVFNSNHCGALAYFAEKACEQGMIGIAMTHATPKVKTPGSNRPFVGINPMCFAAPMDGEQPFCYDSAPTPFSNNKVKMFAEDGLTLPPGVSADQDGNETLDPNLSSMLLPIGDYKGFGLAMVIELFCGLLSGMPAGPDVSTMYGNPMSQKRLLAQFYGAIKIDMFEDPNNYKQRLKNLADRLRKEPQVPGQNSPMMPGDPEKEQRAIRNYEGIPVTIGDYEKFLKIASECGVTEPHRA